ncbi:hypothetical protein DUNSADRAFT_5816 [Dunaliella salina]|uniref:RRM domain-containing protein n=1 Tax=Dunaliella salina TaxID=3046 RepID=A0ABQ7GPK4_DUNSA|nr:hypothetical protein DUNSADRAFT_5816 [Dunaliella salina]|eukprot:KAF5836528.1 hypothetical protein DUNSADRAFT_5816 [Dunaliella salina]
MDDAKTVLARPFPLSTTEDRVKALFETLGRVKKVKLRRDEGNQAFRGSVYVEFESRDTAAAAVSNPPLRPNSKTESLEVGVMHFYTY